ncbi:hypothetical protein D3C71_1592490 [compost metagenome]
MRDITHIRLVDAHAEGDGGDEAELFLFEKRILMPIADIALEAGMIGQCVDTLIIQPIGRLFHLGARQAINDAARTLVA